MRRSVFGAKPRGVKVASVGYTRGYHVEIWPDVPDGYLAPVLRLSSVACETGIRCSGTDGSFTKQFSIFELPLTSKQKQDLREEKEVY